MTILLYKDGRLLIDDGNPIEGDSPAWGKIAAGPTVSAGA